MPNDPAIEELKEAITLLKAESKRLQEQRDNDRFRFIVTSLITFFGPLLCAVVAAWAGAKWGAAEAKAEMSDELDQATARVELAERRVGQMEDVTADLHQRAEWDSKQCESMRREIASLQESRDQLLELVTVPREKPDDQGPLVTGPDRESPWDFLREIPEFRSLIPPDTAECNQ